MAWLIGYAQGDITPKLGESFMAGFGNERYAIGALTPLRAQALAISDETRSVLLLTADVLAFDPTTVERIRRAVQARHGLLPASVMLCAGHTHWGPAVNYRVGFYVGPPNPWYMERLETMLFDLADRAFDRVGPGSLAYTSLETRIGHNRRLLDATGRVHWAPNPRGSYDTHTPVLVVTRRRSPRQIVLVGHACHPTSSGKIPKWTADYPGSMREYLETELGNDTRAMFVMGCGGEAKVTHWNTRTRAWEFSASPSRSAAAGRKLARAVRLHLHKSEDEWQRLDGPLVTSLAGGALTFAKPPSRRSIEHMAYRTDKLDRSRWWARQSLSFPDSRRALPYQVQAWRFGNQLTILGMEGEVCSPLGPLARGLCATPAAMAIAYTNSTCGYIPDRKIRREGGYEGEGSHRAYFLPAPFSDKVETEFKNIVRRAIRELRKS